MRSSLLLLCATASVGCGLPLDGTRGATPDAAADQLADPESGDPDGGAPAADAAVPDVAVSDPTDVPDAPVPCASVSACPGSTDVCVGGTCARCGGPSTGEKACASGGQCKADEHRCGD